MNLLVTGAWREAQKHIPELERMGHAAVFLQQESGPLPCDYSWVEGVICNGLFQHHPIERFVRLRYIQLTSAGTDQVPMAYIRAQGIELHNARGVYSVPMAEHAVWGVLELYRQGRFFAENQKSHRWEKRRDLRELSGRTVCIVGRGSVGTECAKRFAAFGCEIVTVGREMDADAALSGADIVLLALPLTAQTRHWLDADRLAKLKPGAVLVNLARGAVVDEPALIAALETGALGGAVLDVFEEEPLPADSPLWALENVIVTPHNSFAGDGNAARLWNGIRERLEDS